VRLEEGRVHANVALPGLALHYTVDGSEPTAASPRYTEALGISSDVPRDARIVSIASFDTRGRSSRVATIALKDAFDA